MANKKITPEFRRGARWAIGRIKEHMQLMGAGVVCDCSADVVWMMERIEAALRDGARRPRRVA